MQNAIKGAGMRGNIICTQCGTIGIAEKQFAGNFAVELIMWIVGFALMIVTAGVSLLIGIAYTWWRRSSAKKVCKECGGAVVWVDTPEGTRLLKLYGFVEDK